MIGVAEAAANLLCVFNIAEKKDDKHTNIRKSNERFRTVRSVFSWPLKRKLK